ncbi:MAG: hypothetical protein WAV11_00580 [Minisyncoccia bacterium]
MSFSIKKMFVNIKILLLITLIYFSVVSVVSSQTVNDYQEFSGQNVGSEITLVPYMYGNVYSGCCSGSASYYCPRSTISTLNSVKYYAQVLDASTNQPIISGATVATTTTLRLHFVSHKREHVFWFINMGPFGTPYGSWINNVGSVNPIPQAERTYAYTCENYQYPSQSVNIPNTPINLSFGVIPPAKTITNTNLICNSANDGTPDQICNFKPGLKIGDLVAVNFKFSSTPARLYSNDNPILILNWEKDGTIAAGEHNDNYVVPAGSIPFTLKAGSGVNTRFSISLNGPDTATTSSPVPFSVVNIPDANTTPATTYTYFVNVSNDSTEIKDFVHLSNQSLSSTSGIAFPFTATWLNATGTKQVCAIGQDNRGNSSDWVCRPINITGSVVGDSPTLGNSSCNTTTGLNTIYWTAPVGGSGDYRIYNDNNSSIPVSGGSLITSTSFDGLANGLYHVYSLTDSGGEITPSLDIAVSGCEIDTDGGDDDGDGDGDGDSDGDGNGTGDGSETITCRGVAPIGYVAKYSGAVGNGDSSAPRWTYVPKGTLDISIKSCNWTCQEDNDDYTYSKVGNTCSRSTITEN